MRRLVICVAITVLISPAYALGLSVGVDPGNVWEGGSVIIGCSFDGPQEQSAVRVRIGQAISTELVGFEQVNETYFTIGYTPPVIGDYEVECGNGSAWSPKETFTVSRLETEIVWVPSEAFTDNGIEIHATVVRNDGDQEQLTSSDGLDFSVELNGQDMGISGFPYYYQDHWVIETVKPDGLGQGNYVLRLAAEYGGTSDSYEVPIDVMAPLAFSMTSVSPNEVTGGEDISVGLEAYYHNQSVLSASDVWARLDGNGIEITRTSNGFTFVCPDLDPSSHTLEAGLSYAGMEAGDSAPLYFMIPVSAEIRNGENKGVQASIKFVSGDWQKIVKTNVNGAFTTSVPAGVYDIEMYFPGDVSATAGGVEIDEELDDFVRFDTFSSAEIDGIRVAKAFAVEFSPDFDDFIIRSGYDGSAVNDESELELYTCEDWNMDTRKCLDDWTDLDFDMDAMANEVEFGVDHFSGFVVGKRMELYLDFTMDRSEYMTGQTMKISGVVENEEGSPVQGARIEYSIEDGADGEITTNSNGIFSLALAAPSSGGRHDIEVKATKDFYRRDSKNMEFDVKSVSEFTIIPPLRVDANEGSEAKVEATVVNTGQETMEGFYVALSGIPDDWYSAYPEEWVSLAPDDEKKVTFTIKPEEPAEDVYTVSMDVTGGGISKSESFVMYVKPLEEEKATDGVESAASGSRQPEDGMLDYVTVYLTGSTEALINTSSLLISGILVILILRRIRSRQGSGGRAWIMAVMQGLRTETMRDAVAKRPAKARRKPRKRTA